MERFCSDEEGDEGRQGGGEGSLVAVQPVPGLSGLLKGLVDGGFVGGFTEGGQSLLRAVARSSLTRSDRPALLHR